jgi:hypothetical protein
LDTLILSRKQSFDRAIQLIPRDYRVARGARWYEFLRDIAPLVAEREALLKPTYITPRWRQRQIRAAQIDSSERRQERAHRELP